MYREVPTRVGIPGYIYTTVIHQEGHTRYIHHCYTHREGHTRAYTTWYTHREAIPGHIHHCYTHTGKPYPGIYPPTNLRRNLCAEGFPASLGRKEKPLRRGPSRLPRNRGETSAQRAFQPPRRRERALKAGSGP